MLRNTLLVIAAGSLLVAAGVGACGGNGGTPPHLDQSVMHDLATNTPPPDMVKVGPGCFAILTGTAPTKSPQRSIDLVNAFLTCQNTTCGNPNIMDGGTGLPCSMRVDGGLSSQCNNCLQNITLGGAITFTDMAGNPIMCVNIDTGAQDDNGFGCSAGVGACSTQISNCVFDCNSDKDCMGLTIGGMNAVCDTTTNQCGAPM